jgi:hypothetical protein
VIQRTEANSSSNAVISGHETIIEAVWRRNNGYEALIIDHYAVLSAFQAARGRQERENDRL